MSLLRFLQLATLSFLALSSPVPQFDDDDGDSIFNFDNDDADFSTSASGSGSGSRTPINPTTNGAQEGGLVVRPIDPTFPLSSYPFHRSQSLSAAQLPNPYSSPFAGAILAAYDIDCPNTPPSSYVGNPNFMIFPSGIDKDNYETLHQICANSAWNEEAPGLGCECTTDSVGSSVPRVRCDRNSSPNLLYISTAPVICRRECKCRQRKPDSDNERNDRLRSSASTGVLRKSSGDGLERLRFASLSSSSLMGQGSFTLQNCGARCLSRSDCSGRSRLGTDGSAVGCECLVRAQIFDQKNRRSWFSGACGVISHGARLATAVSGGKMKRDVNGDLGPIRPCMCNSTYVSAGCCGAEGGLVWESPESAPRGIINLKA